MVTCWGVRIAAGAWSPCAAIRALRSAPAASGPFRCEWESHVGQADGDANAQRGWVGRNEQPNDDHPHLAAQAARAAPRAGSRQRAEHGASTRRARGLGVVGATEGAARA